MGVFGSGSPKRHRMFSNDESLLERLCARAGYMSRADQQQCEKKLVKKYIDKKGTQRCVGIKEALRESAYLPIDRLCFDCILAHGMEFTFEKPHLQFFSHPSPDLKPRHYPPAFGDFIAMLAIEKPNVAGSRFFSPCGVILDL